MQYEYRLAVTQQLRMIAKICQTAFKVSCNSSKLKSLYFNKNNINYYNLLSKISNFYVLKFKKRIRNFEDVFQSLHAIDIFVCRDIDDWLSEN